MADVKVTQREMFNEIIALAEANEREDIVEFAKGRIAMLDKKKSGSPKVNEENEVIKATILKVMADGEPATVSAIMKRDESLAVLSNQKISAMLRQLIDAGKVDKAKDKKATVFTLIGDVDEGEDE
jgi:hypothetical protein